MTKRKDNKKRVLKEGEYQRKDKGTYEFKWTDKNGKRHSISARTLEELREKELDVLSDKLNGINKSKNNLTINDLYNYWVQLKRGLKKNTFRCYRYVYTRFVEPSFGKNKIVNLKRSDVRAFYNYLAEEKGLQPNTINNVHTVLHQALEIAVEDDYLRYNPSDNALKELKKVCDFDVKKKKALTLKEQELFENFLKNNEQYKRWYPIFITMLWTGMRVGEITGLRWCDVDFENDTISINHTLVYYSNIEHKQVFMINTPKTKAGERTIPMLPKVKEAILMEKEYQRLANLKSLSVVDGYQDFIFINRFGYLRQQDALNKAIKRIIKACNLEISSKNSNAEILLPQFSNHSLRHTFTTRMCEAGINIKAMQEILGHADAETTMDIYAEATEELKRSEIINLEGYFNAQKKANS